MSFLQPPAALAAGLRTLPGERGPSRQLLRSRLRLNRLRCDHRTLTHLTVSWSCREKCIRAHAVSIFARAIYPRATARLCGLERFLVVVSDQRFLVVPQLPRLFGLSGTLRQAKPPHSSGFVGEVSPSLTFVSLSTKMYHA